MMSKTLIFDFDGTIVDSVTTNLQIIKELAVKNGYQDLSDKYLANYKDLDMKKIIKEIKLPFVRLPFFINQFKKEQKISIPTLKPFAGIKDVLVKLNDKGYILGILTSNGKDNVLSFLKKNNLQLFSYIYADIGLFGKKNALIKMIRHEKLDKDNFYYVGDEIRDVEASRKASIKIIAVTWGMQSKEMLEKYKPDYIINKPAELLSINY